MTVAEERIKRKIGFKEVLAVVLPVILGIIAWGLWIYEITFVIGWSGTAWLKEPMNSEYLVVLITIFSYLSPILLWSKAKWYTVLLCTGLLYAGGSGGYYAGKWLFTDLYSGIANANYLTEVWGLFALALAMASIFFFTKQFFLFKSGSFHVLTLLAVFISVIPASLATIEYFPGYGEGHSFVDAVKMGYPIFWVNVMMGWVAFAMVKKVI